ncbi:hypothetical protein L2E82_33389 [Cichorium intybus]|uniref:Uncharacterized protein n=1 Tax=Cichorium intybus TaxID=13427 RepID=A0ACB9BK10_CICIN|nr:hypothetical protein L2E82_33389 [Cichorium intybus]
MARDIEEGQTSQPLGITATTSSSNTTGNNAKVKAKPDPVLATSRCFSFVTIMAYVLCIIVNVMSAIRSFKNVSDSDRSSLNSGRYSNIGGTVAKRTPPEQRHSVQHEEYKVHSYNRNGLCAVGFMDDHYPVRSAFSVLNKVMDEYQKYFGDSWKTIQADSTQPWPYLNEALTKFQDPGVADKLLKIQRELDETKIILHKTIDSVLERGEKLDSLVEKSSDLSAASEIIITRTIQKFLHLFSVSTAYFLFSNLVCFCYTSNHCLENFDPKVIQLVPFCWVLRSAPIFSLRVTSQG